MKHGFLALLLTVSVCLAQTASELFPRATVATPHQILYASIPKAETPEAQEQLDRTLEMLRFQFSELGPLNPSVFISTLVKAQPSKLLVTAMFDPQQYRQSWGLDVVIAVQTRQPLNSAVYIGALQMLAKMMKTQAKMAANAVSLPTPIGNLSIEFLCDNTLCLIGRSETLAAIHANKTKPFKIPHQDSVKDADAFMHVTIPEQLGDMFEKIMYSDKRPAFIPEALVDASSATLAISIDKLLTANLYITTNMAGSAEAICDHLKGLLEQGKAALKNEPTLMKYLSQVKLDCNDTTCTATLVAPWQVGAISIPAAMLLPALSKAREKARAISCVSNLKQQGLAIIMFTGDNDDTLPAPATWQQDIKVYIGDDAVFKCPANPNGPYVYLGQKVKLSSLQYPSKTILVYETFANHPTSVNVLFADGHVEGVPMQGAKDIEELAAQANFIIIEP